MKKIRTKEYILLLEKLYEIAKTSQRIQAALGDIRFIIQGTPNSLKSLRDTKFYSAKP
jgi:hypothetical protein